MAIFFLKKQKSVRFYKDLDSTHRPRKKYLWCDCAFAFWRRKITFSVVATKDSQYTETLISKISSKLSISFEQHKSNPSSRSWSTQGHWEAVLVDSQQEKDKYHCTSILSPRSPSNTPSETKAGKHSEILELVGHESRIIHLKIKCLDVQKCLYFLRAIFLSGHDVILQ